MKILHVVALIQASTGGPAVSVTRLASEQAKMGHEVTLACLDYPHLGPQVGAPGVRVVSVKGNIFAVRGRGWSPKFRRVLREEAEKVNVVHNHGLWMWPNAYAREAALAAGKPLIISPRGMLEAWSLNRSKLRKAVAWRLFEKENLRSAAMFHATAASEARSIEEVFSHTQAKRDRQEVQVVVAPNGVDLPHLDRKPGREILEAKFPGLKERRWVVFMSRLHPKKGIDVLLRAWRGQQNVEHGAGSGDQGAKAASFGPVLIIAGSDLIGYRKDVKRMIKELGLEDSVVMTGEVSGEAKDCLLGNADFFVLPSYSENFGIVVAEAMAWGRPVIASTGTPWREVSESGAGWWVKPEEGALTEALREALGKGPGELDGMGTRGRALVAERYTWAESAGKLVRAYEEIVGTGGQKTKRRKG